MKLHAWLLCLGACGGTAVIDGGGGHGGTSGSTSTTTGTTQTTSVTTGTTLCLTHRDCIGGVCVFATGTCAPTCQAESCDSCTPGTVCDGCATSSCPKCADCIAACVPVDPGQCDDDDACPPDQVCVHRRRLCAPACTSSACADPNLICAPCVSGSCCGCKDCVSACVSPDS